MFAFPPSPLNLNASVTSTSVTRRPAVFSNRGIPWPRSRACPPPRRFATQRRRRYATREQRSDGWERGGVAWELLPPPEWNGTVTWWWWWGCVCAPNQNRHGTGTRPTRAHRTTRRCAPCLSIHPSDHPNHSTHFQPQCVHSKPFPMQPLI